MDFDVPEKVGVVWGKHCFDAVAHVCVSFRVCLKIVIGFRGSF